MSDIILRVHNIVRYLWFCIILLKDYIANGHRLSRVTRENK